MPTIEKRLLKSGNSRFKASVRLTGWPSKRRTFDKKGDALTWARALESDIKLGRVHPESIAGKYTVAEMIDKYLESARHPERYLISKRSILRWWKREIGELKLSQLTAYTLAECREKLVKSDRGPASINRYFIILRHCINTTIRERGWLRENPVSKVTLLKESRGRIRFLDEGERERLLAACRRQTKKPLYLIVVLAISTGARKMELLGARVDQVDFTRSRLTVYETKNGEPRPLYLYGLARTLLQQHFARTPLPPKGYIFPAKGGKKPVAIDREWRAAVKAANIKDFHFHDLRHSAASYLAMNGATTAEIAEVLGHKTASMVKRYAHLSTTHTAGVVAAMNEKIFGKQTVSLTSTQGK